MPNALAPHRSGAHRVAAIALYRALLTQCRILPFTSAPSATAAQTQRDELQNIVRHRFKQSRFSQSARHLRISFDAGYEALDHLDASVAGDVASSEYISALLQRAPTKLKLPPCVQQQPMRAAKQTPSPAADGKPPSPIFDRPLPLSSLSGRRHVPVLVNANQIPILRIKKPQPESLSGYINHRVHKRQVRLDRRHQLSEDQIIAAREDEWDELLESTGWNDHEQATAGAEPKWAKEVDSALEDVQKSLNIDRRRRQTMAIKMQAVVDREQALYDQEERERKDALREKFKKRSASKEAL